MGLSGKSPALSRKEVLKTAHMRPGPTSVFGRPQDDWCPLGTIIPTSLINIRIGKQLEAIADLCIITSIIQMHQSRPTSIYGKWKIFHISWILIGLNTVYLRNSDEKNSDLNIFVEYISDPYLFQNIWPQWFLLQIFCTLQLLQNFKTFKNFSSQSVW